MDLRGRRESRNIEDRRSQGRRVGGGVQVGGLGLLAIVVVGWFFGVDVTPLLQDQGGGAPVSQELTAEDQAELTFVSRVLGVTEDVWTTIFREQLGETYTAPVLVAFKDSTASPCGGANGATGPFYCPIDQKAYLDTGFFVTLDRQLGAKGDFAAAYVVAHEIGHHVQNELGILAKVNTLRARVSEAESNELSVRTELQADCFSGIWSRAARDQIGVLSAGDVEEAVNAARRIGDDVLQKAAGRRPMPHTFTHGTAEQRSRWFVTGFKSGQIGDCDTFTPNRI